MDSIKKSDRIAPVTKKGFTEFSFQIFVNPFLDFSRSLYITPTYTCFYKYNLRFSFNNVKLK